MHARARDDGAEVAQLQRELRNQIELTATYRDAAERLVTENEAQRDEIGRLRAESAEEFAAFTYGRGTESYFVLMSQWHEHIRDRMLGRTS